MLHPVLDAAIAGCTQGRAPQTGDLLVVVFQLVEPEDRTAQVVISDGLQVLR